MRIRCQAGRRRKYPLRETERIPGFPLILFGKKFWSGLLDWMQTQMRERNQFISRDDLKLFTLTDDPGEVVEIVTEYLRRVATGRGVRLRQAKVQELSLAPETGWVRALKLDSGDELPVGFLIDASGFARLTLGRTYRTPWRSFSDWLPSA